MIIRMTITARPQQRYDHRLRNLVHRTGDLTIATDLGVPRGTARGWLIRAPEVVVSLDVTHLSGRSSRAVTAAVSPSSLPQSSTGRFDVSSVVGDFAAWIVAHGHSPVAVRRHLRAARLLDQRFRRRGLRSLKDVQRDDLRVCAPGHAQDDPA